MSKSKDIEMQALGTTTEAKIGFARVASWMTSDLDNETFIYRKFDELGARNLLYMQCEILLLEKELDSFDRRVVRKDANMELRAAARTLEELVEQSKAENKDAKEHLELIISLRSKIKEYHEALILQSQVASFGRPSSRAVKASRVWMNGGTDLEADGTKPNPVLGGIAKDSLDNGDDLVALKSPPAIDLLSRTLRDHWPVKEEASRDGIHRIGRYDERSITIAVSIVSIVVAALLLVGAITALHYVGSAVARLLMIYAFTAAFALSVSLMTTARRVETFAAYAAILVVFVGTGGPGN